MTMTEDPIEKIAQLTLDAMIKKHTMFLIGKPGGARIVLKFKDLSRLHFRSADISGADFTGSIMAGCHLEGGKFVGTSFYACDLYGANFENANCSRADFRGAYVICANLKNTDLTAADMREGKVTERKKKKEGQKTMIYGQDMAMRPANFSGSDVTGSNMQSARATGADFTGCLLSGVNLRGADLRETSFESANLTGANLTGTDLRDASLKSAIVIGTVIEQAEVQGLDLSQTVNQLGTTLESTGNTIEPMVQEHSKWVRTGGQQGKQMDLSGLDMRPLFHLRDYPLTAVKAVGAVFLGMNLAQIQMQSGILDNADFRDTIMTAADLRGSRLVGANLMRANLKTANFSALTFRNPDGTSRVHPSSLAGADLRFAILTGVNLAGADLTGANLMAATLAGANLTGADLRGANLENTDFTHADLTDVKMDQPEEE